MRQNFLFICIFYIFLVTASCSEGKDMEISYASAKIYFLPWDVSTRSALSYEDLKFTATIKITMPPKKWSEGLIGVCRDEIESNRRVQKSVNDGRLIAEFEINGVTESYFADNFTLCRSHDNVCVEISKDFKDDVSSIIKTYEVN